MWLPAFFQMSLTCLMLPDLLSSKKGRSGGECGEVELEQHSAFFTNFSEFVALLPCCLLPQILHFLRNIGYTSVLLFWFYLWLCFVES